MYVCHANSPLDKLSLLLWLPKLSRSCVTSLNRCAPYCNFRSHKTRNKHRTDHAMFESLHSCSETDANESNLFLGSLLTIHMRAPLIDGKTTLTLYMKYDSIYTCMVTYCCHSHIHIYMRSLIFHQISPKRA